MQLCRSISNSVSIRYLKVHETDSMYTIHKVKGSVNTNKCCKQSCVSQSCQISPARFLYRKKSSRRNHKEISAIAMISSERIVTKILYTSHADYQYKKHILAIYQGGQWHRLLTKNLEINSSLIWKLGDRFHRFHPDGAIYNKKLMRQKKNCKNQKIPVRDMVA